MNVIIQRKIDVQTSYTQLVKESTIVSGEILCPPGNAGVVYFRGDDGADVPWQAGEWHEVHAVDLAKIQIKGTVGDIVTFVGGIW